MKGIFPASHFLAITPSFKSAFPDIFIATVFQPVSPHMCSLTSLSSSESKLQQWSNSSASNLTLQFSFYHLDLAQRQPWYPTHLFETCIRMSVHYSRKMTQICRIDSIQTWLKSHSTLSEKPATLPLKIQFPISRENIILPSRSPNLQHSLPSLTPSR